MPLKLRLKEHDKLIIGGAFLQVDKLSLSTVTVSVEAPEDITIFKQRKTTCHNGSDSAEYDESSNDQSK